MYKRQVDTLCARLSTGGDFPHEVGLFLGYPVEDVIGFIENKGKNCLCCGCWKCYSNACAAQKAFDKFRKMCIRDRLRNIVFLTSERTSSSPVEGMRSANGLDRGTRRIREGLRRVATRTRLRDFIPQTPFFRFAAVSIYLSSAVALRQLSQGSRELRSLVGFGACLLYTSRCV